MKKRFLVALVVVIAIAISLSAAHWSLYLRPLRSSKEGLLGEPFACPTSTKEVLARWGETGYSRGCYSDGKLNGPYVVWAGGVRVLRGHFTGGVASGMWEVWHRNGNLYRRFVRAQGKDNGPSSEWYENGQPRATGEFANGWKTGPWTFWDSTGHPTEVTFTQGIPSGDFLEIQSRPCPPGTRLVGPESVGSEGGYSLATYRCVLDGDVPHGWAVIWDIRGHRSFELAYENGKVVSRRSISN